MAPEFKTTLVIDDEKPMRNMLRLVLEKYGYNVTEAASGEEGLRLLSKTLYDYIICDIRMPGMDGKCFLKEVSCRHYASTIIMMSAFGTIDTAIECIKLGAFDYISKPFKNDEVVLTLRKAEERQRLLRENKKLREKQDSQDVNRPLIYLSSAMAEIDKKITLVADSSSPVLILGETGTGKELVARALHAKSQRRQKPFVAVNCSAIADTLIESELFGHAKGAFTGADRERPGLFAAADGGTLFLDEIGELPLEMQPKLLRVLQEGEVRSVGETRSRRVDVRVLAATARDLKKAVAAGRFRDDLFYRLAVIELEIPPLRKRPEDIPPLANCFLRRIAERESRPMPQLTTAAFQILKNYKWPGNVRELENFLEKTMIFCCDDRIDVNSLPWETRRQDRERAGDHSLKVASRRLEEEYIREALAATGGNRTRAAQLLEVSLRSLLYKIKEYEIE